MHKKHTFKTLLAGILFLASVQFCKAQQIFFEKHYGDEDDEVLNFVKELPGGNFLIAGYYVDVNYSINHTIGICFIKTNNIGDTIFEKKFPLINSSINNNSHQVFFQEINNRIVLSFCYASDTSTSNNGYMARINTDTLGQLDGVSFLKCSPSYIWALTNGNYFTETFLSNRDSVSFSILDSNCKTLWQTNIDSLKYLELGGLIELNGNIYRVGQGYSYKYGGIGVVIYEISENGGVLKAKFLPKYPKQASLSLTSLISPVIFSGTEIITSGVIYRDDTSANADAYICKFNSNFDTIWFKTFHQPDDTSLSAKYAIGDYPILLNSANNQGLIFLWSSNWDSSTNSKYGYLNITLTDSNGNTDWSQFLDTSGQPHYNDLIQTSDGGFALVGSRQYPTTGSDFYFVKLTSFGTLNGISLDNKKLSPLTIYPNPATNSITLKGNLNSNYSLDIYNVTGALVATFQKQQGDMNIILDRTKLVSCAYMVKITTAGGNVYEGKLILE